MTEQRRRTPHNDEEAAAFTGLGQAVTVIRERRGMDRDTLAEKAEMTRAETREAEGESAIRAPRSDAAEGKQP